MNSFVLERYGKVFELCRGGGGWGLRLSAGHGVNRIIVASRNLRYREGVYTWIRESGEVIGGGVPAEVHATGAGIVFSGSSIDPAGGVWTVSSVVEPFCVGPVVLFVETRSFVLVHKGECNTEPFVAGCGMTTAYSPQEEPYVMIPSHMYVGGGYKNEGIDSNLNCPQYNYRFHSLDERGFSDFWFFPSERAAYPAIVVMGDKGCLGIATETGTWLDENGVGVSGRRTEGLELFVATPYVETPGVFKFPPRNFYETAPQAVMDLRWVLKFSPKSFHPPRSGSLPGEPGTSFSQRIIYYVSDERDAHAFRPFIEGLYYYYDERRDTNPWMSVEKACRLEADCLLRHHYEPETKIIKTCYFLDTDPDRELRVQNPNMCISWISGIPAAFSMFRQGVCEQNEDMYNGGIAVMDNIAGNAVGPAGVFYQGFDSTEGRFCSATVHSRILGEALFFLFNAYGFERNRGIERSDWLETAMRNVDVIAGQIGKSQGYHSVDTASGCFTEKDSSAGLLLIPPMVQAFEITAKDRYLESAVFLGSHYAPLVKEGVFFGATIDQGMVPTPEDGFNSLMAYARLHAATGNAEWLELACKSADWMHTFLSGVNQAYPPESLLGQRDFRSVGSIGGCGGGGVTFYGVICLPEQLYLWRQTGNQYYLHRAEDTVKHSLQMIAEKDSDYLNARKGFHPEQYYNSVWTVRTDGKAKGWVELQVAWGQALTIYGWNEVKEQYGQVLIDYRRKQAACMDALDIENVRFRRDCLTFRLVNRVNELLKVKIRIWDAPAAHVRPFQGDIEQVSLEPLVLNACVDARASGEFGVTFK